MSSSVTRVRGWLAGFRGLPVVLSCPLSPGECLRRLAMVTTQRGFTSWHLDARNARRPAPRLRGDVGPSRILVARFADAAGRNSFAPWLDLRLEDAAGGGATLTGSVGLHPAVRALIPVIAGVWSVIALGALAGGVTLLASGHISGLLLAALIPLASAVALAGFNLTGLRSLERAISKLICEMNEILGSTAIFSGPAAIPAADSNGT